VSLIRITVTGDTLWSKLYDAQSPIGGLQQIKTIPDVDGNLFTISNSKRLMWTDISGNLLKSIAIPGLNLFRFSDAGMMPNGDKILLFQSFDSGNPGALIIRVNKDASSVIWSKFAGGMGAKYLTDNTNLVIDGNRIILGGALNDAATGNASAFLGILNADDGSWISSVIYNTPSGSCTSKKIYKTGNGYILAGWANFANISNGDYWYMRLSTNLQVLASKQIGESLDSWEGFWPIVPQPDGSFYGAYGGMNDLSLFKISNQDLVTWMKIEPNNLSYPYYIEQNGNALFVSGLQPYDNTGVAGTYVNFFLSKSDLNGELPGCPSIPRNDLQITDAVFSMSPVSIPINDYLLTLQPSVTSVTNNPMEFQLLCHSGDPCTSLKLLGDSAICNSNSVLFTGRRNDACTSVVQWKLSSTQGYQMDIKNDSTVSFQFSKSGKYLLKSSVNSCTQDSMWLYVNSGMGVNLGPDTTICNAPAVLHAGAFYKEYLWQDGSTDSIFNAASPGEYRISVTDFCDNTYRDTIEIKSYVVVHLGSDTTLCEGAEKVLNAFSAGASYTWQDGSINPDFTVKSPGVYSVAVNINGCVSRDSISITYQQSPQIETDGDIRLCNGKQMTLEPIIQNADQITWQDGSTTTSYIVKDTGYYSIQATNICGTTTKNIHVSGGVCKIHMPAGFSPDNNGINDRFEVKYPFPVNSFSLSVYNRWGQRVFETHDMSQGWNGKINGEDAPVGGYVWFISVQYTDHVSENLHGTVLLLR
jgi:gliding motility-associated-like protein